MTNRNITEINNMSYSKLKNNNTAQLGNGKYKQYKIG